MCFLTLVRPGPGTGTCRGQTATGGGHPVAVPVMGLKFSVPSQKLLVVGLKTCDAGGKPEYDK